MRTATKRASGSRTNKNDSAGRRLGPKVMENGFVKPGNIIMRQRGTRVHPGDNVGIGKDHTIWALEPGYVRFYLDPFHPLRKYVGVVLKREHTLPKDHWAPRVRRFGYEPILDPRRAQAEEDSMSRKEELAQPELKAAAEKREARFKKILEEMTGVLNAELSGYDKTEEGASRLAQVAVLMKNGQSYEEALDQITFDKVFDTQLAVRRGEISAEELAKIIDEYKQFAADLASKITLDYKAKAHRPYTAEEIESKTKEIVDKLESQYTNIVLHGKEKAEINALIDTPGVIGHKDRVALRHKYIPNVLPESVPGTVVEKKGDKIPKNAIVKRVFNPETRELKVSLRTKEAFPRAM